MWKNTDYKIFAKTFEDDKLRRKGISIKGIRKKNEEPVGIHTGLGGFL